MKRAISHVVKISRPRFWLYLAGPALLGIIYGAESVAGFLGFESVVLFLFFLVPANVFLYGVNDVFDRRIDRNNPKKEEKEARFADAPRVTVVATVISGVLGAVLLSFLQGVSFWAFVLFFVLAVGYSMPPLRFKARPVLDSVSNGLYVVPGLVTYGVFTGGFPVWEAVVAGWLWTMAMHTFSAIPDIEPDREEGVSTTATVLGRRKTLLYCTVVWMAASVVAGLYSLWFGGLLALYPVLSLLYWVRDMNVGGVYWYYPYVNAVVGMVMSFAGLFALA